MTPILPVPENEAFRIERLKHYAILDTEEEEMFDHLTKLAAKILEVPICLMTFVDENRQWFKSKEGMNATETPREIAFCQYAIMDNEVFVVNDSLLDDRFKDNPLVHNGPKIRFYAGAPFVDEYGAVIGALCAIDRIPGELTEEKKEAMELVAKTIMNLVTLRREKLEAEKLARVKDEFLSNMSHEIRTPLNAIIGFNDLLSKTTLTQEQEGYLETVTISSQNLKVIINDILDVAKLESGNFTLEKNPVSLSRLMNHVIKLQGHIAKEKGIKLLCNIDHEIPDFIYGDETRLTQIFINLVSNAIKFTKEGYVELKSLAYEDGKGNVKVTFSVRDTGIGIPKDKLKTIFERFSQAETSTTRLYGGTGLGLSIVHMLVKLHEGTIAVRSERNKGSEFEFEINFEIAKAMEKVEIVNPITKENQSPFLDYKILLVEDNIHNQLLAKTYYKRWGADIDLAENGQIALDMIAENKYDIVIMDLQMPVMDGFKATEKIRLELKLDIPIVGCSAHSLVGEKEKCIALGMNDYIAKPYTEDELINTTLKYLNSKTEPLAKVELSDTVFDDFDTLLKNLISEEGDEFVKEITGHFKERVPKDIIEIKKALQSSDMDLLKEKSHFVAGSLGVFGFDKGHKLAITVEECVKAGDIEKAKTLGFSLIAYLEEALVVTNNN